MLKRYKSATVSIGALLYYIWTATNVRSTQKEHSTQKEQSTQKEHSTNHK